MTGIVTRISTMFTGLLAGEDAQGNRYYTERKPSKMPGSVLKQRRWVIYNGPAEPTRVPPEWHAWLHHIVDDAPTAESVIKYEWQKDHQPNQTGTRNAYKPSDTTTAAAKPDSYQAWNPEG